MAKLSKPTSEKGRLPLKLKKSNIEEMNEIRDSQDVFKIPTKIKEELARLGLSYKFINMRKYKEENGFHRNGWKAHKFDRVGNAADSLDFSSGLNSEGYLVAKDQVLAVKSIEEHDKYRRFVKWKNDRDMGVNKIKADELREMARNSGTDMSIKEGYEDESDDNE